MHHKRRRRRRAGIKGCCGMCMLQTTDGRRNGRLLTKQERRARLSAQEQIKEQSWCRLTQGEASPKDSPR